MKTIYFDCTSGISGDMVFSAMMGLCGENADQIQREVETLLKKKIPGTHCRHYSQIRGWLADSPMNDRAKAIALKTYGAIAKAEAFVHGEDVEHVHFHEVGRDEAVGNIVGIALCAAFLDPSRILCSKIHDGSGFVECSHGTIPVPVPAVMALRRDCDYIFVTEDGIETEMVTPSGLAMLMGLDAVYCQHIPAGEILRESIAFGKRKTGKEDGFKAILLSGGEAEFVDIHLD